MDEQRIAAYSNLLQQLLQSPGEVNDIANVNRELMDANFVKFLEFSAALMAKEGNSNVATFLKNLAAQLAIFIGNTGTLQDYLSFLDNVIQATKTSSGNLPVVVYPILQKNLDKLNLKFAVILQNWGTLNIPNLDSEKQQYIAAVIVTIGDLIDQFTLGRRAWNIEISIACYETALIVYTYEQFPQYWGGIQNNLAIAYRHRIEGEKAQNIERAIACYQSVLKVYTPEPFPQEWAEIQHNLGNTYSERIQGEKAENIEQAIAFYESALIVRTREQFPPDWAMTQNNLAITYRDRIQGEKAQNIEQTITCFQSALKVHTLEQFPQQWAQIQNDLGNAYRDRIQEKKAQNIEDAIACYNSALKVHTLEQFPQYWASIQNNLGNAYCQRIQGEKAQNIELAIACYNSAVEEVYTREQFPQDWAQTQNNLGNAYGDRIQGEKAQNIEKAIACFELALKLRTYEQFPQDWAMTQNNLAIAYRKRIEGEKAQNIEQAIACFGLALKVRTYERFPQDWAATQNNLGNAYIDRIQGEKAQNIERAIACCKSALIVYTYEQFPQNWATTQHNLGNAYNIMGEKAQNIEQAIACYREALIVYTPTAFPLECLSSSKSLGNIAFTAGLWEIAIEGYEQAMTAVEQSRSWITSDDRRQQIVAESIHVYENAIQACINSSKLEKAIEYCDRTRSKHLVDLMHSNDLYASGEIPPEVARYLREFEAKQQEIDAEVEQLRNPSSGNKGLAIVGSQSRSRADVVAYTDKIAELEAEKQQVWENIRRLDPVLAGQIQVDRMEFAAMQKLIENPYTAILCFYTTDDDTHIFVIYKDKAPQVHTCHGEGWATFQKWVRESWLSPYLADNKSWQQGMGEFLSQLSQRLKVKDLIGEYLDGIEELIVIPHLFLHQIPLAALPVGENAFLGDKFLIRYVPSCKILEYCHQRQTIKSPKYGIVENATDDLYFTPFECEEINKIVRVKEHLKGRKQATVANYRDLVKTVNVLHSSHHAKSRLDNPLASELLLGNGSITLGELMTPGWRLPDLSDVFLSCCETNLGLTKITDDILTLGTGFLCAGARSVVSTLWAVDDLATSLFSIFYYQFRQQVGCSRPDALRRAQVRLRTISGAELEVTYKSQINAILLVIVKNLNLKLGEVQAEKKELKLRQESCNEGTDEFKELKKKLKDKAKEENQIRDKIKGYESRQKTLYAMSNPFADLIYWSGFICQGLH